jgi:hypothetical protein
VIKTCVTACLRECLNCGHFRKDSEFLEACFPGLTSMSLGYGSVRASDGICLKHDRYLSADSSCPPFEVRGGTAEARILPSGSSQANPSPAQAPAHQQSSYFSSLLVGAENNLLSDVSGIWWSAVDDRSAA